MRKKLLSLVFALLLCAIPPLAGPHAFLATQNPPLPRGHQLYRTNVTLLASRNAKVTAM